MDNVIQNIKIEDIVPNNHRQYNERELNELVASIKQLGLLEPITVRPKGNKYELILGNKRYKAATIAGLKTIPAIIKEIDDNRAKEYLMINNDSLIINDTILSNSTSNNLDVINLSKLNEEYERDDLKMNNNQFANNNMQQTPNNNNEPTFGGRFFPSLEDEPTNMNFGTPSPFGPAPMTNTQEPTPAQQTNNNFIDLTDLNITPQPQVPQMPQNNFMENQSVNNEIQPSFSEPTQNLNQTMQQTPINENNNIINLESLKQNQEIGTQPINQGMNIDNNFQEVINDFSPVSNNIMATPLEQNTPNLEMQSAPQINENTEQINNQIPEMMPPINGPQPIVNPEIIEPNFQAPVQENIMPDTNIGPIMTTQETVSPTQQPSTQKDVLPIINTLKGLAVNLEAFGYTIRITDEDLSNAYKITIEVDK